MLTVNDVMTQHVVTTSNGQSVKNAARVMANHGISCLLVFSNDGLKGIVTERDIVTRVVCTGLDPCDVSVGAIMSEPVIVIGSDTPLEQAAEIMLTHRIKKLPVMDGEGVELKVVGILSLIDVASVQPDLIHSIKEMIAVEMEDIESSFYVS
jgi:CBS domain-containing protein